MQQLPDPRFFVSTQEQRDVFQRVMEAEPQHVSGKLWLGSRLCLATPARRDRLRGLGVTSVLACCDRAPDAPLEFAYLVVPVDNETRDSRQQHARHAHADGGGAGCCGAAADGACRDLHLLQWLEDGASCVAERLCRWIDAQPGAVLVHGFDGVSNSAAVVVAYLMWKDGLRLSAALELVTARRPIVAIPEFILADLRVLDTRLYVARAGGVGRIVPRRNAVAP